MTRDRALGKTAPPSRGRLVVWYGGFALLAMAVNLGTQSAVLAVYRGHYPLLGALAVGTLTGLVTKYLLDKRWIFQDFSTGLAAHGRKFSLYSLMGLVTTAIFWGCELAASAMFGADWALVGGGIGLTVGYVTKYHLDRRYVFGAMP